MARGGDERIVAIEAAFQNGDIKRFLKGLPIFRVERDLPEALEDKLKRLERAEDEAASGRNLRGSRDP